MSTRGAIGIRLNNKDKVGYNHYDSYPSGRGLDILNWLKDKSFAEMENVFKNTKAIKDDNYDKTLCDVWDDDNNKLNDTFRDAHTFLYDSLFCEYAYIINLDDKVLEFYKGFNKSSDGKGRYAPKSVVNVDNTKYYGVALIQTIPLNEIFEGKWAVLTEFDKFVKG